MILVALALVIVAALLSVWLNIQSRRLNRESIRRATRLLDAENLLYSAWVLIANSYGGNWDLTKPDWRNAAEEWRDNWHHHIRASNEEPESEEPV